MTQKLMILHLSDIHIHSATDAILGRVDKIASTTFQHLPEIQTLLIVISGDISYSGAEKEFGLAVTFIDNLKAKILKQMSHLTIEVFVCPGNHDCDFSGHDETREAVLARIRTLGGSDPSPSLINTATAVQDQFFEFRDKTSIHKWSEDNRLAWKTSISVEGKQVGVRCLNIAWMSELKERQGTLVYPPSAVTPFKLNKDADLAITILHHPFNWLGQSTYRAFQTIVRRESHLIFTGHEHFQNVGESSDLRSSPTVSIEGGVLFESKAPDFSTFNTVVVDLGTKQYMTELYSWNGTRYIADVENEAWGSLRPLPVKGSPTYELNSEFATTLIDPGANFSHSAKKSLVIDDIFVWPDLRFLDDPAPVKKQVSGAYLEDVGNLNSGIFIRGDEKSGKSTLLRRYFSSYYGRGYLPLYFRGSWFTNVHQTEPLKALKFALDRQYRKSDRSAWLQEPKDQRVLLLDDIDGCTLAPEVLSRCLEGLFGYFSGVIVTAKDSAAAMDLLSIERVEALHQFAQYEVREFGHKKRFELVCKWAEIGGHQEDSPGKWMATIDNWEKDLTTAVGRQFVPSVPIFLLTLLQSIESGRTADLQNSAFGHYYQFLVTSALENVGIDRGQWSEVINYCANLAWLVHSSEKKQFSEKELETFSTAFSREFTPVAHGRRERELIQAGILARVEGQLAFKYSYLFYYFLGQYFADRMHEPEIEQEIVVLCDDLHLRDNANILLFTSHHTKSPVIYQRIAQALDKCFSTEPIFDFVRDAQLLNQLVDSAPQLIYEEDTTKASRAKVREAQDRSEDAELETSTSTSTSTTDIASAMTRLFRGMEILGQFLKNHYGTTKNPVKDELIQKLLDAALRGLHGTSLVLIRDTDALTGHIERILADKRPDLLPDLLKANAKRVVFDVIGMITFAFVQKAGSSVGSAYLKDNLRSVVESNQTLAYALVEMAYQFDLPEAIPFSKLKELNRVVEKNVFSRALLRTLALRHLHLFKVPYKDKQRLCEELEITLNKQAALRPQRTDGPDWLTAT